MGFYRYFDYALKCIIRKIIYSKWFWRISFLIIMLIIMFNFTSSVFAAEVPVTAANGLRVQSTSNPTTLILDDRFKGVYFPVSKGLTYTCTFPSNIDTLSLRSVFTTVRPASGVTAYDFSNAYDGLTNYSFISKYDGYCMFFNLTDVEVVVQDDIDSFDLVPIQLSTSSCSVGSTNQFVSGGTTYFAYLENNVEYTVTLINSGSSIVSVSSAFSSTVPYVDGYHTVNQLRLATSGATSFKVVGQNNYFCIGAQSGISVTIGVLEKEEEEEVTLGDLEESINNNDSAIINGQENINNSINEQGDKIENAMTSTEYDENSVTIDTSALDDLNSNTDIINYPMQIVNKLSNMISTENWGSVDIINITIPFTGQSVQLRSDMLYNFIKNSPFYDLLQVFWVYTFGRYLIFFGLRIYHWLRTGEAVRKTFNLDTEAITASIM